LAGSHLEDGEILNADRPSAAKQRPCHQRLGAGVKIQKCEGLCGKRPAMGAVPVHLHPPVLDIYHTAVVQITPDLCPAMNAIPSRFDQIPGVVESLRPVRPRPEHDCIVAGEEERLSARVYYLGPGVQLNISTLWQFKDAIVDEIASVQHLV